MLPSYNLGLFSIDSALFLYWFLEEKKRKN